MSAPLTNMDHRELLLVCLAEECMEVAQRVTKALRFGLDEVQPGQDKTNAQRIVDELDDVLAIAQMLEGDGIPRFGRTAHIAAKTEKVRKYLDYSTGATGHPESPAQVLCEEPKR